MAIQVAKTTTMIMVHFAVGCGVAYALTGSLAISGMVALVEPLVNVVFHHVHERVWTACLERIGPARTLQTAAGGG
ncbi:MAG: DUF2061 domain-containing protein [Solirubrobacterales bacterium]